jgi:hypothetical protein
MNHPIEALIMDYPTLRIVHLTGLALTFMGLTGVLASKAASEAVFKKRWIFHISHGVGLLLLLASGIALGLKLGVTHPAPLWLQAKFGIWLLAGGAMVLATRFSRFAGQILIFFTVLVLTAAWLAIDKPF